MMDGLGEVVFCLWLSRGMLLVLGKGTSTGLLCLFLSAFLAETTLTLEFLIAFGLLTIEGEKSLVFRHFVLEEHA